MTLKSIRLKNRSDDTSQSFVAIGTATLLGPLTSFLPASHSLIGEDYPTTGRILLLEIFKDHGTDWQGRIAWTQECRAPVNAVAVLDGNLLVGIGNRLELCAWTGRTVTRLAFFDAPIFITSVNVLKSFVLFGDYLKGIHFVWYTIPSGGHDTAAEAKEMMLLGKDFDHGDVVATEFLVNGTQLCFVSADDGRNLHLHGYHRDHPDSWNGRKLLQEGSFHVGHGITKMLRMRLICPDNVGRQAVLYGTLEGSIGHLSPVWDPQLHDRLLRLQHLLWLSLPQPSGLNPAAFRSIAWHPARSSKCGFFKQGKKTNHERILDFDLITRYLHLDRLKQEDVAQRGGMHRLQLMHDIRSVDATTTFF